MTSETPDPLPLPVVVAAVIIYFWGKIYTECIAVSHLYPLAYVLFMAAFKDRVK